MWCNGDLGRLEHVGAGSQDSSDVIDEKLRIKGHRCRRYLGLIDSIAAAG